MGWDGWMVCLDRDLSLFCLWSWELRSDVDRRGIKTQSDENIGVGKIDNNHGSDNKL